ncbi:hypothetical protein [Actinomadura meridiana]|uniref:hypothetical protein n=1 Tax=Actinomadura meridiana TaxID=559626 RepID=UPI0031E73624
MFVAVVSQAGLGVRFGDGSAAGGVVVAVSGVVAAWQGAVFAQGSSCALVGFGFVLWGLRVGQGLPLHGRTLLVCVRTGLSRPGTVVCVPLEKPMTPRIVREGVFVASALATTSSFSFDEPVTTEPGTRMVAPRATAVLPMSPRSQRSWLSESACTHLDECFIQVSGRSTVSRSTASLAVPPSARTRTV